MRHSHLVARVAFYVNLQTSRGCLTLHRGVMLYARGMSSTCRPMTPDSRSTPVHFDSRGAVAHRSNTASLA